MTNQFTRKVIRRIKLAALPFLFSLLGWCFPQPAQAQFLGYTSPQTTTSFPFGGSAGVATPIACTGSQQVSGRNNIQNVGQSAHFVYMFGGGTSGTMVLQGSNDGTNFENISEVGTISVNASTGTNSFVVGSGYYNFIRVAVNCTVPASGSNTFVVFYSGTSVTPGALFGSQQLTQYDKSIGSFSPLTSFTSQFFQPPFGSSAGLITVTYSGTPPSGSTLAVICKPVNGISQFTAFQTTAVANTVGVQSFLIPPVACPSLEVGFTPGSGGSTPAAAYVEYVFALPGLLPTANSYLHVTGTTATAVKPGPGNLHTLAINTAAAGTVSFFDLVSTSCTGTPSTNLVAVVTVGASNPPSAINFDAFFTNGICMKASAVMDLTVNFN
jgi:hypothetical protein